MRACFKAMTDIFTMNIVYRQLLSSHVSRYIKLVPLDSLMQENSLYEILTLRNKSFRISSAYSVVVKNKCRRVYGIYHPSRMKKHLTT